MATARIKPKPKPKPRAKPRARTETKPRPAAPRPPKAASDAPAAVAVDQPCATCGIAPTQVTTATRVAVNPPVALDGAKVKGGATIHHCPHCGQILAVLKHDVEAAAGELQAAYEREIFVEAESTREGSSTDGSADAPQQ